MGDETAGAESSIIRVVDSDDEREILRMQRIYSRKSRKRRRFPSSSSDGIEGTIDNRGRQIGRLEGDESVRRRSSEYGEGVEPSLGLGNEGLDGKPRAHPCIDDLSNDLLIQIFMKLPRFPDLILAAGVCKRWKSVVWDPELWTSLSFEGFEHVTDETVRAIFEKSPRMRLKSLSLAKCHALSSSTVRDILNSDSVRSLESLDLSWFFGSKGRRTSIHLTGCRNLKSLKLAYCWNVRALTLTKLPFFFRKLEVLDVNCCGVSTVDLMRVADFCPHLRHVNIVNAKQVKDPDVTYLVGRCPQIEVLNLSYCPRISDVSLASIAQSLPNLRELGLSETMVSNFGLKMVVEACKNLEELLLARCSIDDAGAECIVRNCRTNLKTLNLASCCDISDNAVKMLLQECKGLTNLDVSKLPCRRISLALSRNITVYY